ncbi:MAG: hypothetical protein J6J33_05985, partial [Clostridia bacterium]|nr:hypothetical protein [Clostridia bacterium]
MNIKLSTIYTSVVYGDAGLELGVTRELNKSIWDRNYIPVKEGDKYDPNKTYSVSSNTFVEYKTDAMDEDQMWTYNEGDASYYATSNNTLFAVDTEYLYIKFNVAYGTKVTLGVKNEEVKVKYTNASNLMFYFNGWYLHRNNQISLSTSVFNYDKQMSFYATKDYYGSSLDIIAKYSLKDESFAISTTKEIEIIDDTANMSGSAPFSLGSITEENLVDNVFISGSNKYMFAGWWQVVTDSTRPATYILVSNDYFSELPNVTYLVARFVRLTNITVSLPRARSGYLETTLNYRYAYMQANLRDNRYKIATKLASDVNGQITYVFEVPVDSFIGNIDIHAWAGHYYKMSSSTYDIIDTYDGQDMTYRINTELDNYLGKRYYMDKVQFIMYNLKRLYLNHEDKQLYETIGYENNIVKFSNKAELQNITYEVFTDRILMIYDDGKDKLESEYPIQNISTVSNGIETFYVFGRTIYRDIDRKEAVTDVKYLVENSVVIFGTKTGNDLAPRLNDSVNIETINKAGYTYRASSDYDVLTVLSGGYTISYVVTTNELDGSYSGSKDKIVGGSIQSKTISSLGGTISPRNTIYSSAYSLLTIQVLPVNGYTFVGLYINGKYVDNSYNSLTTKVDLSDYNMDIVVEARFARNVTLEYRIAVDNSTSKQDILNISSYLLSSLNIEGVISNIYNSITATYVLGDKVYSTSTQITDIKIQSNEYDLLFRITVPYGTKLNFGMMKTSIKISETKTYNFNGWYLYNTGVTLSTNLVSSNPYFSLYAVENRSNMLSFVAKYSTVNSSQSTTSNARVELYHLNDFIDDETKNAGLYRQLVIDQMSFETFVNDYQLDDNVLYTTIEGRKYVFTGWWQILNSNTQMLVSNKFIDSTITADCIARFVEYREITIDFTENSSVSLTGYLHNSFAFIQSATTSAIGDQSSVIKVEHFRDAKIVASATILSAFTSVVISSQNGYFFMNKETINNPIKSFSISVLPNMDMRLYGNSTYKDSFSITSNLAEVAADEFVKYEKISQDLSAYLYNIANNIQKDTVEIDVI